ncbi:hydantoinase/carbamoylase family amidase [Virgibacillus halophilus]|uniref:Hydantoinase/carbamoylase family amidase n=1 Tax=Tigheibacillus halophilus TaxID=361280 RepID=A0ABU5C2I7_9BACI|nr:hydantoinase/carbamoylase family amidase [Virgibacillus halophilus]
MINGERLWRNIHELAAISEEDKPWTRRSFTAKYNEGRKWLVKQMEEIGLEVQIDEAANVTGKRSGTNPELPPIVIGSHTDTVPDGGRFDGIAGVLAGLEVLRTLKEQDIQLPYTILLTDFTAEEPSEYGLSTVGSRAWAGNLTSDMLQYKNAEDKSLSEAIAFAGGDPENIAMCRKAKQAVALYLELHIEQGPVLLHHHAQLGVVTGIVGIQRYKITVDGQPNHAGTTPMNMRMDALTAASEIVLALEKEAKKKYDNQVVGTIGTINNYPNASNVVPGKVEMAVEIRSVSDPVIDQLGSNFKKRGCIHFRKEKDNNRC